MSRTATALPAALALLTGLVLAGCSSPGPADGKPRLEVGGAFIPEPVNADMAGGFLTVTNSGDAADTLTSVTSDLSDDVQMHETRDHKMRQVDSFDLPAHGELRLERGGSHLMFMDLKRTPKRGDKVRVALHFEESGPIEVEIPVEARTHDPRSGGHTTHGGHGAHGHRSSPQHDGTRH
ncbi:copper chaperone PCu(A)C [Streptomyces somaliensis DSM 40738]|uniref:Copper chaperone PCu(A)C n=1 Tax=Streptomyces somaliensis (strain ATCC 33201 / DSM 40738 / JCM 12659 / KCTC 9044 / NCTC 11332 / NRRL B-12077 / IP 733) TaxID=1134445 RepID=A0AA44DG92_STRE0|nr:copper chaperone PCu(A)C [Streptomyces somaliensis]MCQ0024679.1 copper chaperone PCu(A)C [Streptomyces somaliensis DSM 40738]NKY16396.1 copper chaperone PCu(A)C [Streptomyces somaliensis DSM 40738]